MDLWDIEVLANPQLDKHFFISMEVLKSRLHCGEHLICMGVELSIVYKTNSCAHYLDNICWNSTCNKTNENLFYFFMLAAGSLLDMSDSILEVLKASKVTHSLEPSIYFSCSIVACCLNTPTHKVVLEDTFMELMQDVRSDGDKYVKMGKVLPKW
jgi:hypothetical protein